MSGGIVSKKNLWQFVVCLLLPFWVLAQPANDNCSNATTITIGSAGFALGAFNSTQIDISTATLQTSETFAPGILTAGLSKKSIWYKFSLPTTRSVEVFLKQPSVAIADGNVGFAVYKTSTCLPGEPQISTKLTPIAKFASSKHPCLEAGDYYVQVSANSNANGLVFISLDIAEPDPAPYDKPATASKFGTINANYTTAVEFAVGCQSIENNTEVCLANTSFKDYTQSTWHTFTTPDYFDFINLMISGNGSNIYDQTKTKIGFRLFEGDIINTPLASLTQIGGCDSLMYNNYAADYRLFKCGSLKANVTYTVQLLYPTSFTNTFRLAVAHRGSALTRAPQPLTTIPAANKLGVLPSSFSGISTTAQRDVLACNSRHANYNCPKALPIAGHPVASDYNIPYNLSTFYSFTLANTANILLYPEASGWTTYARLYQQGLVTNCSDLDTSKIVGSGTSLDLTCLPPGDYVVQLMGTDSFYNQGLAYVHLVNQPNNLTVFRHLGFEVGFRIVVSTIPAINKFSLNAPGAIEKINANGLGVMQPVQLYKTYTTTPDTLGCSNTVLPADFCYDEKASYREFVLADSGIFRLDQNNFNWSSLYKGDANALATAQNAFNWPQKITGLTPVRRCMVWNNYGTGTTTCVTPGTFSLVGFGPLRGGYSNGLIVQNPSFSVIAPKTKYNSPQKAQDMGDLWATLGPGGGLIVSDIDTFSCYENPAVIDGYDGGTCGSPYRPTKLIYRQFYLSQPTNIEITTHKYGYANYHGWLTLFSGKASDGITGLKSQGTPWTCFWTKNTAGSCTDLLPPGWYTVVAYGHGGSYENPLQTTSAQGDHSSLLGQPNAIYVTLFPKTCASPQFNRPQKASVDTVTKKPYLIEWGPQTGHTAAYPATHKKYTLNKENFDCTQDTAFIRQSMAVCPVGDNVKVAFYVFQITQESYVNIIGIPEGLWSSVYAFDVRTSDSVKLKTTTPLQPCTNQESAIEFCKLQPGYYTLLFYAPSSYTCNSIQPTIYIDQVGYSRFDHAAKAYDFGNIKPDSVWYNGKVGDVNPLNAGRAPSNDFFYCTTGAAPTDPVQGVCLAEYNPLIYTLGNNTVLRPDNTKPSASYIIDRRNLWYTFTVKSPGWVSVRVKNKTPGMQLPYDYSFTLAVFKSDVDASLPYPQVVSNGLVDSTSLQGLSYIRHNLINAGTACAGYEEISFFVEPCSFTPTRYYVLVENRNPYLWRHKSDMNPNRQMELSILLDSLSAVPPKFDHYSQAADMGVVNSGIKKGPVDNFTCATRDFSDPTQGNTCNKTLWYKFTTTVTGTIRYAAFFKNTNNYYYDHIQLFRQTRSNDSSSNGLLHLPHSTTYSNNGNWAQQCISPGTYYLILPGCNAVNEDVYPQIEIIPAAGDFCSAPMIASLNGVGNKVVPVTVDCHTIGTDYGEFNQTLTCPANALTKDYKTSWYRLDIGGTDTLDLTVFINEKTNAGSTDIKYRMMTGSCGAMQEQSCVQDALTRNTYECMVPGNSYYIQVFTPVLQNGYTPVTGDIELNISSVKHAGACAPANNCIAVAEFFPKFDCTKDKNITITNLSTFGSDIKYDWDFGYNNQKSNAVSPEFFYPALTNDKTYTIKLIVTNLVCGKKDSITKTIDIPARPSVNLGNDTVICTGPASVELDAASHSGTTYQWYTWVGYWNPFSTNAKINVTTLSSLIVELTYNNCKARDTVNVWINPITKKPLQTAALCGTDQIILSAGRGQGEQYQWNNGSSGGSLVVTQPGYYWCDLYLNGCIVRDSFLVISPNAGQSKRSITVCQSAMPYAADATISGASSYNWNDNNPNAIRNLAAPGVWWVDITISGCTIRDSILLAVDSFKTLNSAARICSGQNYRLPSGKMVNNSGLHRDTLRNVRGCDSLINNITLTVETATRDSSATIFYAGQTYRLPWGRDVQAPGIYRDTLKSAKGCDSLYRIVNLRLLTVQVTNTDIRICFGNTYTLPWGKTVSNTGVYADTVKSSTDADSLIKMITLTVLPRSILTNDTTVCEGVSFSLRTMPAISYSWSPSTDLSGTTTGNPVFTARQNRVFTLTATYDFSGNSISCNDKINITVLQPTRKTEQKILCIGQSYTLPGGKMANATGLYRDTLRGASGCDSIITILNLTVQAFTNQTLSAFICQGQNYRLPSGRTVNTSGLYRDTLRYVSGCDSSITIVNLTRFDAATIASSATICLGNTYTLPSGKMIAAAGTYRDTLRYTNGCDSIRYTVTLSVTDALRNSSTAYICAGASFRLPSGRLVSTAGLYRDTVRTAQNCDSLISNITLVVDGVTNQSLSPVICQGTSYKLPSGRTVSAAGNYRDTQRNIRGCDSIRFSVNLSVSSVRFGTASATLCAGQTYTRPSGKIATASGIYLDTLRSAVTGCDSIVTTTLTFRPPLSIRLSGPSSVCTGVSATLTATASGGNGGPYTYSWTGATGSGNTVTVSPSATTKYIVSVSDGCTVLPARDSVTITYVSPPQPGLNNATVTICRGSSVTLTATGGATYLWSPATGLSNTAIARPVASPLTDTRYRVQVTTATGCIGQDSILVKVTQPFTLTASLDTFVCAGGTVPLSAAGAVSYEWAGAGLSATTGASVTARPGATTTYTVTGYGPDNCFTQTKNIRITVIALPVVNAGRDTTIMVGSSFVLRPSYTGNNLQYNWTPATYLSCADCARPTASPREPIEYSIEVRNAFGCTATDKLRIELRCNAESIFLPNTFTPNGDGANDIWYPRGGGIKTVRYLKVFNRWGQVIFERSNFSTDDRSAGWDGTYQGQPLPPDVFVYTLGTVCDNGQNLETKGNVMIVR